MPRWRKLHKRKRRKGRARFTVEWALPIGGKVYKGTGEIPDDLFWRWMKDVPPAEREGGE